MSNDSRRNDCVRRLFTGALALLMVAGLGTAASAQSHASDSGKPAPSGLLVPVGANPMLSETQWSLTGQVRETFDDNILMSPASPQNDAITAVLFNLGDAWSNQRLSWNFEYLPEFSLYAAHSRYDDVAQSFGQGLNFRWTGHTTLNWNVTAHRYPSRSAIPGFAFGLGGMTAGGSISIQQGAIISGYDQSLGLTHATSRHSRYSLGLTTGLEHYSRDTSAPEVENVMFGNSVSWGANGGWSHDFARHLSMGIQSSLSRFQASGVGSTSRYATVEATLNWQMARTTSVTMGAGPSWTSMASRKWNSGYAASFSLEQSFGRSAVDLFWNRTTQLAQIQGGLQTDSWGGSYNYSIGAWNWGASFGQSSSAVGAGAQPLRSRNAVGFWGYRIAPAWIAKASYSHGEQVMPGAAVAGLAYHRNQWEFELDHVFAGGAGARAGH